MQVEALTLDELLKKAGAVARSLRGVTDGKPPEERTQSNVETFAAMASMLEALSQAATRPRADAQRWNRALNRIANLEVRNAVELLERQQWSRIAIELQAIAQEAVSGRDTGH